MMDLRGGGWMMELGWKMNECMGKDVSLGFVSEMKMKCVYI